MKCVPKDFVTLKVLAPESVTTLYEIVEEARAVRPLDRSLASACLYTKHSQEILEYEVVTCPKDFNKRDNKHASTPLTRNKQVTFVDQCVSSNNNTHKHVEKLNIQKTNVPVLSSTGVNSCTDASGSKPRSNTKKNRTSPAKSVHKKKVKEHPWTNKSSLNCTNRVDSSIRSTRTVVQMVLWYLDSGCSKHMIGDRSWLKNFIKKFIRTVRFRNDHFGAIMGYGDYVIGDSVISRVYYVEGLGHNLFSIGKFCDSDLEVAFKKHSCYVRDIDGAELIKGSCGSNLYTILVEDMLKSTPICLLSKASKNKSWLWHRRLNHLNFGTINDLARKDLVRGLPRLKFEKDHLCLAYSEDIQCAGFDHDHYQEAACAYNEEHMMHDCVQLDHVVDSHDEYTSDSNIIMCDQYVRDNEVPIVHSGASSIPTDDFMMIYDDMCEPHDQSVSYPSQNTVVKNSLTAELAIYKEHVEL
nr:integrase, catalytic region, zinc finger, CCHC-type, peptidase aspartic, catalytic [Tanacetum cinerariifolium]